MMPIYYNGFVGLLKTWFVIGVTIAGVYAVQSIRKGRKRHWFHFDGDLLSFGDRKLWAEWWVVSCVICFVLSFLMVAGDIIREMAWSLPESVAFMAGTFAVDRLAMIFEGDGPVGPRAGWKWPEFRWPTWGSAKSPDDLREFWAQKQAEKEAEQRHRFDNLTRGH